MVFILILLPHTASALADADANFSSAINKPKTSYHPFLEIGTAKYFRQSSSAATAYDLFIPLWQKSDQLLFTDLRIFDRSGNHFEGNAHLGYRKMDEVAKQMFGIYGAFDRKRTIKQNYFNQLTFGVEYWYNRLFIGGNIYQPIGVTKKQISFSEKVGLPELNIPVETTKVQITTTRDHEKTMGGIDAALGYEITDSLTGYAGGYYFAASEVQTVAGPRIKFTYDYAKANGHLLGILDSVSVETGLQYDKPRRFNGYIGIKFKIDLTGSSANNLQGFSKHMVELVRRDEDIVYGKTTVPDISGRTSTHRTMVQDLIEAFGLGKIIGDISTAALVAILAEKHSVLIDPKNYLDTASATRSIQFYTALIYGVAQVHERVKKTGAAHSAVVETFRALTAKVEGWKEIQLLIAALPAEVAKTERPRMIERTANNFANKINGLEGTEKAKQIAKELFDFVSQDNECRDSFKDKFNDEKTLAKFREFFRKASVSFHPDKGGDEGNFTFLCSIKDELAKAKHNLASTNTQDKEMTKKYALVLRGPEISANDPKPYYQYPRDNITLPSIEQKELQERIHKRNQGQWSLLGSALIPYVQPEGHKHLSQLPQQFCMDEGCVDGNYTLLPVYEPLAKVERNLSSVSNIEPITSHLLYPKVKSWLAYFALSKLDKIFKVDKVINHYVGNDFKLQSVPLRFLGKYAEKFFMGKNFTAADEWDSIILSDTSFVCWFAWRGSAGTIAKIAVPVLAKILTDQPGLNSQQAKNISETFIYYSLLVTLSINSQKFMPNYPLFLEFLVYISAKCLTYGMDELGIVVDISQWLCSCGFGTCAPPNVIGTYVRTIGSSISSIIDNLVPASVEEGMDRALCSWSEDYNKCMASDKSAQVAWLNHGIVNTVYFISVAELLLHRISEYVQSRRVGVPTL